MEERKEGRKGKGKTGTKRVEERMEERKEGRKGKGKTGTKRVEERMEERKEGRKGKGKTGTKRVNERKKKAGLQPNRKKKSQEIPGHREVAIILFCQDTVSIVRRNTTQQQVQAQLTYAALDGQHCAAGHDFSGNSLKLCRVTL